MTTLYLIRHGQTDNNHSACYNGCRSDQPLNERGLRQAAALTRAFSEHLPDVIYASPLRRAIMTAEGVRGDRDMPITTVYDLREMDMGDLDGVTFAEVREKHPELWHHWRDEPEKLQMPNGESYYDVQNRAAAAISQIVRENRGKRIAVVAHSVLIRLAVAKFLGFSVRIPHRALYLVNASYHTLSIEDDGHFTIPAFRRTDHFTGDLQVAGIEPIEDTALLGRHFYANFGG